MAMREMASTEVKNTGTLVSLNKTCHTLINVTLKLVGETTVSMEKQ